MSQVNTTNLLLLLGLGVAGYFLYKQFMPKDQSVTMDSATAGGIPGGGASTPTPQTESVDVYTQQVQRELQDVTPNDYTSGLLTNSLKVARQGGSTTQIASGIFAHKSATGDIIGGTDINRGASLSPQGVTNAAFRAKLGTSRPTLASVQPSYKPLPNKTDATAMKAPPASLPRAVIGKTKPQYSAKPNAPTFGIKR